MVTRSRAFARLSAVVASAALAATAFAAPAHAADTGLFGSQDPTYDGVYRQSLAIAGLEAAGANVPAAALTWLIDQQCADGGFMSYRADTSVPCGPSDADTYSGPDSNSTAVAATALYLAGKRAQARRAAAWLIDSQNDDWGFPYYSGGESDANSTGLALVALQTVQPQDRSARVPNGKRFLGSLKRKCSSGGGLAYQKGGVANGLATAQAYAGLAGGLPVSAREGLSADPQCTKGDTASNAGSFLAEAITAKGAVPSDFSSGPEYSSTGWAILGLVGEEVGARAVSRGVRALETNARAYALADGQPVPAALGLLALVAEATDENPRAFGGLDLVTSITGSMQ